MAKFIVPAGRSEREVLRGLDFVLSFVVYVVVTVSVPAAAGPIEASVVDRPFATASEPAKYTQVFAGQPGADQKIHLPLNVDGLIQRALLEPAALESRLRSLRGIRADVPLGNFYTGVLAGYPGSSLRLMELGDRWRGLLVMQGEIYRVDGDDAELREAPLPKIQRAMPGSRGQCGAHALDYSRASLRSWPGLPNRDAGARLTATASDEGILFAHTAASSTQSYCPNLIDGVCLLPEIEFAYDIAYQNLPGNGLTPMQRALSEINELEMFFESAFNFRFSRVSITMLDAAEDALIGNSDDAEVLLNRLRVLRGDGELDFLENSRSIFHFVTGRDFPPVNDPGSAQDINIVGLAYPSQVCAGSGLNTGLTDAGDIAADSVSLVMAHEIGHNLGAVHDEPAVNGCADDQFIMAPTIGGSSLAITGFSSCSIADINSAVAARLSSSCFDFPVDVQIAAASDNPVAPPAATPFATVLEVTREESARAVDSLRVEAMLDTPAAGRFTSASVAGGSCSVFSDALSCNVSFPSVVTELFVYSYVEEGANEFTISAAAQSQTSGTVDLLESNNSTSISYTAFSAPVPPQPAVQQPASGKPSGGGGATGFAANMLMLCAAALALLRRSPWPDPAR